MQAAHVWQASGKARDLGNFTVGIVEGGDHGHANDQFLRALCDIAGIIEDQAVIARGEGAMLFGIDMLDIHQDLIEIGQHANQAGHYGCWYGN